MQRIRKLRDHSGHDRKDLPRSETYRIVDNIDLVVTQQLVVASICFLYSMLLGKFASLIQAPGGDGVYLDLGVSSGRCDERIWCDVSSTKNAKFQWLGGRRFWKRCRRVVVLVDPGYDGGHHGG